MSDVNVINKRISGERFGNFLMVALCLVCDYIIIFGSVLIEATKLKKKDLYFVG